jgi:hypothetical protein
MPIGTRPEQLGAPVAELRARFAAAGKPAPEVAVMTRLPLEDPARAAGIARAYAAAGATRLVHGNRYADAAEFRAQAETLAGLAAAH